MDDIRETHVTDLLSQKLASSPKTLFSASEIEDLFEELGTEWGLPKSAREVPKASSSKQSAPGSEAHRHISSSQDAIP